MRVLAAQNRVNAHDLALEVEDFKVVGDGEKVHGGRKLHRGVSPVALVEDRKLTGFNERLHAVLNVAEVPHGRQRMAGRDLLLNVGRFAGIGFKRAHHVDPVEGRELIEVDDVVLNVKGGVQEISDDVRILRNLDSDRVLNRTDGGKRMNARADAADALNERPGVARVASFENHFEAAPHGAGAHRVDDFPVVAEDGLHAQMTLNAGDRVNNNSAFAHYSFPPISLFVLARA